MQGSDYRKEYVTCEEYSESAHTPSKVDLMTPFTAVSMQPEFLIMKVKNFSVSTKFCLL